MSVSYSIIIVTWNALPHLKTFLPSVAQTDYPDFEIIIADNASDDGSKEWIQENYPQCKIVTFDKNYGYAGGNNRAVKYASGDILIFLNNDAKPEPGWLHAINNRFKNSTADIIQPKIKSALFPDRFEYAGAAGGMIDWMGYPFCRGRLFEYVERDTGQYNKSSNIFWASGTAFTIKKELFLDSGGFDEDFEFHMEEIDLCWRSLKMGCAIIYEPESVVYHLGGGSLDAESPRKVFYNYRNSLCMLTKNLDHYLIPKLFFRLLLDGAAGSRFLFFGKPLFTLSIIKAHFSFYSMFYRMLKKRKELQIKSIKPTPKELVHQRLIIIERFIKKKKTWHELTQPR